MGIRHEDIARLMGVSHPTLLKHYRDEVEHGAIEANGKVAESLFKKAIGNGSGAVVACIFWLKTRAGWRETSVHQHIGLEGVSSEANDARDELARLVARQRHIPAAVVTDTQNVAGLNGSGHTNGKG